MKDTVDAGKNVHQRLAEVMGAVTYIRKESKKGMQYTIVSHDAVTAKVRPALLAAGIVYYPVKCSHTHNGNRAECDMTVRFVNIDEPTDFFDVEVFGYGVDPQDKGPGKAMSYAVKYALLKALGLETGDDADHDNIDHSRADPAIPKPSQREVKGGNERAAEDIKERQIAISRLSSAPDLASLATVWESLPKRQKEDPAIQKAKDESKAALAKPALADDEIPY